MAKLHQKLQEAIAKFKNPSKQENISWTVCVQYKDSSFKHFVCNTNAVEKHVGKVVDNSQVESIILYKS